VQDFKPQEQVELVDDEAEGHQGDAGAEPREKRALVGQIVPGPRPGGSLQTPSPPLAVGVSMPDGAEAGRIFWGDGLATMRALPGQSLHAIYVDPPFFTARTRVGDAGQFPDAWPSLAAYLTWLRPWLEEARRLLRPDGWFWLHLDWHAVHYAKVLADEVFGARHFRNEIIWHYTGRRQPAILRFNQKHDTLLLYAAGSKARLLPLFEPWSRDEYVRLKRQKIHRDASGREWIWGHAGRGRSHAYRIDIAEQVARGRAVDSVWDIPIINTSAAERTGWPTQKPEALLRRVVQASVPPGGTIGDFMAGSGTTAVAALQAGRRFVAAEQDARAVAIIGERLTRAGYRLAPL
jgi:site-specific DNA-methyltransferase (adenine-specific)